MHRWALEEYGLRCLLQVALRDAQGAVSAREIARAEGLAPDCVARVLRQFHDGGLLQGARGSGRRYRLARAAAEISVWEAVTALGGERFAPGLDDCPPGRRRKGLHTTDEALRTPWLKLHAILHGVLDAITLDELCRDETLATGINQQAPLRLH